MYKDFYPIKNFDQLEKYVGSYLPIVTNQMTLYGLEMGEWDLRGDHLGLQAMSSEEFDSVCGLIGGYSEIIKKGEIHNRRNFIYRFSKTISFNGFEIDSIEVFEPKPGVDPDLLKPGIEHISLRTDQYDSLFKYFKNNNLPIDKSREINNSKFFKTKFINLVEIEFRNDCLWRSVSEQVQES